MKSTARWVSASALLLPLGFLVNACEPDCAATLRCEDTTDTEDDRNTIPRECDPSSIDWKNDPDCGVFVSLAGNDAGAGTPDAPVATLKVAIDLAKGKPVYACADTDVTKAFDEALIIDHHVTLFGGLDCQTWRRDPTGKTHWTAPAGQIVAKLTPAASLRAEGFAIQAKDAPALGDGEHAPGRSSIAIVAETGSLLELSNCEVGAGRGGDGAVGETPAGTGEPGANGEDGQQGCIGPDAHLGGAGGALECGGVGVAGGRGGTGDNGANGGQGSPGQPADPTGGKGGAGQGPTSCTIERIGGAGNAGTVGTAGAGASAEQPGTLTLDGIIGASGADGGPGKPGQGGGGGGGASTCWVAPNVHAGPSGGGGGSGGCAGLGGKGGHAGGASIAILGLNAEIRLTDVSLLTSRGGNGGNGGEGQAGGAGGNGGIAGMGNPNSVACPGGTGGQGGTGGKGGGGRGGHSIGIAHTGAAPDISKASFNTDVVIEPAPGGNVGIGPGSAGAAGEVASILQFE